LRKKLIEHNCSSEPRPRAAAPAAALFPSKTEDPRMNALLSVSDKTGIVEFARSCTPSASSCCPPAAPPSCWPTRPAGHRGGRVTGFPEMLDGRVKTLHPKVHGGLLARRDLPEHMAALAEHGIDTIDLLVVNLYPFEATVAKPGCTLEDAIENIDIGGPAMVRSAAKNWKDVGVLTDASQYAGVLAELKAPASSATRPASRCRWPPSTASPVRRRHQRLPVGAQLRRRQQRAPAAVPGQSNGRFVKVQDLRYGENPHQQAAFYRDLYPARARWSPPAAAGQGAELQQHRRRRCRLGMRQELRRAGLRDRQARQPLRRGRRRHRWRPTARPSRPTRPAASAASSPSTARSTAPRPSRSASSSSKC
jgi:hypothetical protein